MNTHRLLQIIDLTTDPMEKSMALENLEVVDIHGIIIGVNMLSANTLKQELVDILNEWPETFWGQPVRLQDSPSYIAVGAVIGDQGTAFRLFALGKALKFWNIVTPETFGVVGEKANELFGAGFVMIDGYKPEQINK